MTEVLLDSYTEGNRSSDVRMAKVFPHTGGGCSAVGQSFQTGATAYYLTKAVFYLRKTSSPDGKLVARLYEVSGIHGSTAIPTGSPLAESDEVEMSSIGTSIALVDFTFSGSQKYLMETNHTYCIVVIMKSANPEYIWVGVDNSAPVEHDGNHCDYDYEAWNYLMLYDTIFYVYGEFLIALQETLVLVPSLKIVYPFFAQAYKTIVRLPMVGTILTRLKEKINV